MELKKIASYYDTLSDYEKEKLRLMALICKLKTRNVPLVKFVYLNSAIYFGKVGKQINEYQPRRGRKEKDCYPVKLIMEILDCPRRTAMDYKLAMKGVGKSNQLFNLLALAAAGKEQTGEQSQ